MLCGPEIFKYYLIQSHLDLLQQLLQDTIAVLNYHKIKYWIDGGTLLGCVRDHGQIPYDDDIDLGVDHLQFYVISKCFPDLEKLGYKIEIHKDTQVKIFVPDKWYKTHYRTVGTPTLDIFPWKITKKVAKLYKVQDQKRFPHCKHLPDDLFPLIPYKYNDLTVLGPNNPLPYLDNMYPRWQTIREVEVRDPPTDSMANIKEKKLSFTNSGNLIQ